MSGLDLRPPISAFFAAFGVPATVTPKGGAPVSADVIWAPAKATQMRATATTSEYGEIGDDRPTLSIRKDQVAESPVGGTVEAPGQLSAEPRIWLVDRLVPESEADPELWKVIVH